MRRLTRLSRRTSLVIFVACGWTFAQPLSEASESGQIEMLRAEIQAVQQETERDIESLRQESDRKIQALLARLDYFQSPAEAEPAEASRTAEKTITANVVGGSASRITTSGDFRLRYEDNSSLGSGSAYSRGVLRGRLAASFRVTDDLKLGARLVTGNSDDPRTADTTIGDFTRDLDVSFDQMYAEYRFGDLVLLGGKFPKPFVSSELLWDGDVNPQGLAARYSLASGNSVSAAITGIYSIIDEETSATAADMAGGQLSFSWHPLPNWKYSLAIGYYDYDIPVIEAGFPGGARGNTVAADGVTYISDFNLLDSHVVVDYLGFGDRWPLQIVANHVTNRGARVSGDSAIGVDVFAGHLQRPGAYKLRYGYSEAESDAVLGLFSQDNISLGTNYQLHTFAFDYALRDQIYLGLTHYLFRQKDNLLPIATGNDWANRTRLNLYFSF